MLNKQDYKGEKIDFELYKKIINRIAEQQKQQQNELQKDNKLQLIFHGGEVLMLGYEYLAKLFEYADIVFKQNMIDCNFGMQSNITLLNEDLILLLSKYNISLGLSFDGINNNNDQRSHIKQSIFEEKFNLMHKYDLIKNCGMLMVASKFNIDGVHEAIKYLSDKYNINGYKLNYAEDMINPNNSNIEISGEEFFNKIFKVCLDNFIKTGMLNESHTEELLKASLLDILFEHPHNYFSGCGKKFCGAGITMIAIEPDGHMDYCDRYSKKFDNVYVQHALDYDFLGLHQLNKVIHYNYIKHKLYLEYHCDSCRADYICDHGCEAFYFSKHGKYGIETKIVCDQYRMFYDYILNNLKPILLQAVSKNIVLQKGFGIKNEYKDLLNELNISIVDKDENFTCFKKGN
jgi:radical SAM protein with 4Fe4S-binding SPASM domain